MIRMLFLALVLAAPSAFANHPGEHLDEAMTSKEPAFESTDQRSVPVLEIKDRNGKLSSLGDLQDQIVVLSFVPESCGGPCTKQQAVLAAVQAQINVSPMKEMVTFVTVQDADAPTETKWDEANWKLAAPTDDKKTEFAAESFAEISKRDGTLPMAHIIDRLGRHVGIFHGAEFRKTNLTLYVNGLINNAHTPRSSIEKSWWDRFTDWF